MVPIATNFGTPAFHGFMEQVRAHHQVVVEELTRPLAIGADSADDGSQVNDEGRLRVAMTCGSRQRVRAGRNRCAVGREPRRIAFLRASARCDCPESRVPPVTNTRCGCQKLIRAGPRLPALRLLMLRFGRSRRCGTRASVLDWFDYCDRLRGPCRARGRPYMLLVAGDA